MAAPGNGPGLAEGPAEVRGGRGRQRGGGRAGSRERLPSDPALPPRSLAHFPGSFPGPALRASGTCAGPARPAGLRFGRFPARLSRLGPRCFPADGREQPHTGGAGGLCRAALPPACPPGFPSRESKTWVASVKTDV